MTGVQRADLQVRSTRPSSTPATTVAHAPVPQASVRPAPRSHTTMRTWLRLNTCAETMLGPQTGWLHADMRHALAAHTSCRNATQLQATPLQTLCWCARGRPHAAQSAAQARPGPHHRPAVTQGSPSLFPTKGCPEVRWQQRLGAGDACRAARAFTSASAEPKVTACGLPMLTQVISHSRPDTASGARTTVLPCGPSGGTLR
jgi:hypothetical protein